MLLSRWQQIKEHLPEGVNLLAVSKGHSVSSIRQLAELGQRDFGESRLQEALPKISILNSRFQIRWHFIGRLQANKVRNVVKSFAVIHSVDSISLAKRISRIAGEEKRCPEIMLQVKMRDDPNKGGFCPEDLCKFWPEIVDLPNLKIVGLMTMAPFELPLEERKHLFQECSDLAIKLSLPERSMGMSSDWEQALQAGSTWLRLGSILFGDRKKSP